MIADIWNGTPKNKMKQLFSNAKLLVSTMMEEIQTVFEENEFECQEETEIYFFVGNFSPSGYR